MEFTVEMCQIGVFLATEREEIPVILKIVCRHESHPQTETALWGVLLNYLDNCVFVDNDGWRVYAGRVDPRAVQLVVDRCGVSSLALLSAPSAFDCVDTHGHRVQHRHCCGVFSPRGAVGVSLQCVLACV